MHRPLMATALTTTEMPNQNDYTYMYPVSFEIKELHLLYPFCNNEWQGAPVLGLLHYVL